MATLLDSKDAPPTPMVETPATFPMLPVLNRQKWRLLFGALVGLTSALVYCVLAGPWYESTTQLLVVKKHLETSPLSGPNPDHAHDNYLSTHMLVITSPRIVQQAIIKDNLGGLPSFQNDSPWTKAVNWISHFLRQDDPAGKREDELTRKIIDSLSVTCDALKPGVSPSNEVLNVSVAAKHLTTASKF